jgi:cytochrome d ubiquinol oxidase subunit I
VRPWFYLFSAAMVALGTALSAFWIMINNSWMQVPVGYVQQNGIFVPEDWTTIIFNSVAMVRFVHMLFAAYLSSAFCVAATGAWYMLRKTYFAESRVMLRMGLFLAAVLVPVQLVFGHLVGDYVHQHQPAKFAAIEARWHDEQPASEVIIAFPDEATESNLYEIKIPVLGSIVASGTTTSKEVGLTSFPPQDRPPVLIPFLTFRVMVGCGLLMLALAWIGSWRIIRHTIEQGRWLLRFIFLSFPLPFVATLAGWYTAEVGRQPWVVYGVLRTAKAMTPFLTSQAAAISLILFAAVYVFIFSFGILYIYRLLRAGPGGALADVPSAATPNRPMSLVDSDALSHHAHAQPGE